MLFQLNFGFFGTTDRNNFVAAAFDQPLQSPATFRMIFNEQYSHFWNYESPQNLRDQVTREHARFLKNVGAGPFAVWLYNESGGFVFDPTGTFVQPLPNQFGAYNGTIDVAIPEAGWYVVNVMSDGAWEVGIS